MNYPKWMNISEAARYIGMSKAFLRKGTRKKTVPFVRVGTKSLRFDRDALDAWLKANSSGGEVLYGGQARERQR